MGKIEDGLPSIKSFGSVRRKAIRATQAGLVNERLLFPDRSLPLVLEPAADGMRLAAWAGVNTGFINQRLLQHGAILFRGFNLRSPFEFEQFIAAVSTQLLEYKERSSPRNLVSGRIYTSTEYPPDQSIFLHNENSYQNGWPAKIFFFCQSPASQGGETPIADVRKVFQRIEPGVRARFIQKRCMYVRNFDGQFGLPWQTVFQTADKGTVESYCRDNGIEIEWKNETWLRTRQVRDVAAKHPQTGAEVWFNHATFFHVSTLGKAISEAMLSEFAEENLPNNTYYGDGSRIEDATLEILRQAYQDEAVTFAWQEGDVLMLDNMLAAHGRAPFAGPRKILVGMADPLTRKDVYHLGTET
jgi:alpha-ketoglutarate-dependent taurine dioxygenase